jgi:hypothetical protein
MPNFRSAMDANEPAGIPILLRPQREARKQLQKLRVSPVVETQTDAAQATETSTSL